MNELAFRVADGLADPTAAAPAVRLSIEVSAPDVAVQAAVLSAQVRIDPGRRRHGRAEQERLVDVFGPPERWQETARPLLWAQVPFTLPAFSGRTAVDVQVPCTYDLDVAWAKYLDSLDGGSVALELLFSGTVFVRGATGVVVQPVPTSASANYELAASAWREAMDRHFPGAAWLRVDRARFDALQRFRRERALPTMEHAIDALLAEAAGYR
jgi:hypothetical protein